MAAGWWRCRGADLHDAADDGLEDGLVRRVVHAVLEREVDLLLLGLGLGLGLGSVVQGQGLGQG